MERKKTFTMNWDALGDNDDDDDRFFETYDRLSSAVPADLCSSGSDDDDEFEDPRMSFTSSLSTTEYRNYSTAASMAAAAAMSPDYNIWMAAPGSINERRKRLFQGMGLSADKELLRIASKDLNRAVSIKIENVQVSPQVTTDLPGGDVKPEASPAPIPVVMVRSRSGNDINSFSVDKNRKEELLGSLSKQHLTRTSSMVIVSSARIYPYKDSARASPKDGGGRVRSVGPNGGLTPMLSDNRFGAFFLIKNLDTGKEFVVNEYDQDGMWNRVSDLQTGKQLTMEEFEKCVGHSPVVKELMRREHVGKDGDDDRKITANSYLSKSLRVSKRRGAAFLKNIKGVAHSMSITGLRGADKEHNSPTAGGGGLLPAAGAGGAKNSSSSSSGWIKVRQTAKSHKELSALHLCQEIQAHQGLIWTMRFSPDTRFLASGGEDRTIHVWEVQECEIMSLNEGCLTPLHPFSSTPGLGDVAPMPSEKFKKKKKGSSSRKSNPIPEYVHVPESVFSLSERPICSFTGHLDDVLDLSWSRSQLLLSSSMDKTVRLWDMETKSCLKLFAHNDYVTCIHFNPMNDNYFISGSLDNKVRIWNIPDRQLVDWTDLHEMVTAVCYTPDGQGALIGSHKGNVRMYNVEDCKLNQVEQIDLQNKKRPKKITGFQFSPGNPSEVLVSSADSRIRILEGSDIIHKFRGFRNLNSQISASFSINGKYVICASEDSHVFLWKRDERAGSGKGKSLINSRSHESFQCREVSIAIPWPGTVKGDPPPVQVNSKRHSKRPSISSAPPSSCGSPTKDDGSIYHSTKMASSSGHRAIPSRRNTTSSSGGLRGRLYEAPRDNLDASLLLQDSRDHVSYDGCMETQSVKNRGGWRHLELVVKCVPSESDVRRLLELTGFVDFLSVKTSDHTNIDLIKALAERWWDTTNTFHMGCGEMTYTPLDLTVASGIWFGSQHLDMYDDWRTALSPDQM